MRNITPAALAVLAKTHGVEPINVIGIEWVEGNISYYADKNYKDIKGSIVDLGNIDEVLKVTTGNPRFEVSVTLDDFDGDLVSKLTDINLQKTKCYVYQTFEDIELVDMFLVFEGEAVTPIEWDECERTLKFNILSEIDSEEVGFSPEEDQFEFLTDDAVGKVWPLCFGDVVNVPATKSSSILTSVTTTEIGMPDVTLVTKYNIIFARLVSYIHYLNYLESLIQDFEEMSRDASLIHQDYLATILLEDPIKQQAADKAKTVSNLINELNEDALTDTELSQKTVARATAQSELQTLTDTLEQYNTKKSLLEFELDNAEYKYQVIGTIREKILEVKQAYFNSKIEYIELGQAIQEQSNIITDTVKVLNGDKFPQNVEVQIEIKGLVLVGTFNDDIFTVSSYLPKYTNIALGPRQSDDPDSFWLQDANIDLSGHYILTNSGYILKVNNQEGNRCYLDVDEVVTVPTTETQAPPLTDLDLSTWLALDSTSEHTTQEKDRILEQSLGNQANGTALVELRKSITKRVDALREAQDQLTPKELNVARALMFKDMYKYNVLVSKARVPLSATQKINQKISKDEEELLLRAENLVYLNQQRANEPFGITVLESFIDSRLVEGGIAAASTVLFKEWLPGINIEEAPPSTLWVAEPGSSVKLYNDQSETYVANILPSTVHAVYAKRSIDGILKLVPVPSSYYTLYENQPLNNLNITGIKLHRPLTEYLGESWVEGLYVSLTSSVGPNTADIIKYIVEEYTDLTVDATTYNYVKARLENYPSNFALFDKRDALSLIEDIAWQARCLVYVKNKVLYFRYLAEDPTPIKVITYSDVEEGSLNISYSDTESIYTKLTGFWKPHYDVKEDNKSIIRHNIAKYKSIEFERDFFIYNIQSLVEKSLTFWTIRYSNTWKIVQFKTFLSNLDLETWDCVTLDLRNIGLSNEPVKALIEKADYNSADYSLNITCWVPVRAGTMEPYDFAFPADLPVETEFPTEDDIAGGNAGNPKNYPNDSNGNDSGIQPLVIRPRDFGTQFLGDGSDSIPVSPISGLNQVNYKTYNVKVNRLGKDIDFDAKVDALWGFNNKDNDLVLLDKKPFRGYVSEVLSSILGTYKVKTLMGKEIIVNYQNSLLPLTLNETVIAIYNETLGEWSITPIDDKEYLVRVVSVGDDLIDCVTIYNDVIKIVKPYLLRRTPFDGQTYNGVDYSYNSASERVATQVIAGKQIVETQVITPDYVVNDFLAIKKLAAAVNINNVNYRWEDKNTDSRAWAVDFG